jgi:hypothetical protein
MAWRDYATSVRFRAGDGGIDRACRLHPLRGPVIRFRRRKLREPETTSRQECHRNLPVRLSVRLIQRNAFRKMVGYGVLAFAILAAEKLRFQSDAGNRVLSVFQSAGCGLSVTSSLLTPTSDWPYKLRAVESPIVRAYSGHYSAAKSDVPGHGRALRNCWNLSNETE